MPVDRRMKPRPPPVPRSNRSDPFSAPSALRSPRTLPDDARRAGAAKETLPIARRRYFRDAGPVRRTRVNEMIRLSPIRLIDENNKQVGVVETPEAQRMAREAGLDLVEIQADARPPVCKIMDYGKYKYDLSKKEQKGRASSKGSDLKEVRLGRSMKIDPHDVKIRVEQARKFLMDGHKVMIVQRYRGREMMHKRLGEERLREIVDMLSDVAKVEVPPRTSGRQVTLILAPDKPKIEAIKRKQAQAKQREDAQKEAEKQSAEEAEQTPEAGEQLPEQRRETPEEGDPGRADEAASDLEPSSKEG